MKPDVFLFSRTPRRDYRYLIPLPPELSEETRAFVQAQLERMQRGDADGTVHFFLSAADAVLLRLTDSGRADLYARPIVSLEGLYCPAADVHEFWLWLPLLVPGFWSSPSLYSSLVDGETVTSVPLARLLDDFAARSCEQAHGKATLEAIYRADHPVSFTFDADGIHPSAARTSNGRTRWLPAETRRCDIRLHLPRKQDEAYLEAVSCRAPQYTIVRGADITREGDGWRFAELEASARAMEDELDARGWLIDGEGGDI